MMSDDEEGRRIRDAESGLLSYSTHFEPLKQAEPLLFLRDGKERGLPKVNFAARDRDTFPKSSFLAQIN